MVMVAGPCEMPLPGLSPWWPRPIRNVLFTVSLHYSKMIAQGKPIHYS